MVVPCCSNLFQFVPMSHVGWCNFKRCTAPPVPGWSKLAFPCFSKDASISSCEALQTSVSKSNWKIEMIGMFLAFRQTQSVSVCFQFKVESYHLSSAPSVIYLRLRSPRRSTALYTSSTQRRAQRPRYSRAGDAQMSWAYIGLVLWYCTYLILFVFGMWNIAK